MNETTDIISAFLQSSFIPIFLIGGWILVCFSIAKNSGWSKLKEKFSINNLERNLKFHSGTGKIGKATYYGTLLVGTTHSGLVLKVRFPWRFGHPTLVIPWKYISKITISENTLSTDNIFNLNLRERIGKKAFFSKHAEVVLSKSPEINIELPWNDFLSEKVPTGKTT